MKKRLEASLRRAVEDLPRPGWEEVAGPPIPRLEVHDHITRQDAPPPRPRRLAAAWAAVCLLALLAGGGWYYQCAMVYSVVDLTVNPAFALSLNRRDQVRSVDPRNGDAAELLEGRSYAGWTLEAAVGALLDELAAKGYLDGLDSVRVDVTSRSVDRARALREELDRLVEEKLSSLPTAQPEPAPVLPSESPSSPPLSSQEPVQTPKPTPGSSCGARRPAGPAWGRMLSEEEARAILLGRAPGARIDKLELEEEDGTYYYEAELTSGHHEIEAKVDAYSGQILKWEKDD